MHVLDKPQPVVRIGDGEGRYGLCNSCLTTNCSSFQSESPSFNVDFHCRVIPFLRAHVRKFLRVFSDTRQPEVDRFYSWAVVLPKVSDKSSLQE